MPRRAVEKGRGQQYTVKWLHLLVYFCVAAVWWEIGRGDCLERGKGGASKVAEKVLMEWRKGIKGAEAKELEKETGWVEGMELGRKRPK